MMLSVDGLQAGYGQARVLSGISLRVEPGQVVCVMGRTGAGKTTLLEAIMGVLPPAEGRVTFEGHDMTRLAPHERVCLGMAYVPRGHETFPQLSVLGNLQVTLDAAPHHDQSALTRALDAFPGLKPLLKRRAGFLSGGRRRQLAIARALVTRPRLLILDEPTQDVQPSVIGEIEEAIERLHTAGLAVLLVEQYLGLARRLADRFLILDAGRVVRSGTAADLNAPEVHRLLAV